MSPNVRRSASLAAVIVSGSILGALAPQVVFAQAATTAPVGAPAAAAPMAPSATDAGVNTSGVSVRADQIPPAQAKALAAGDNTMVTNGPVPDTPANRAKYGKPMSHEGRSTPPAGN
jgi:hypothetical protein